MVTVTSTVPADSAGETMVIEVGELTTRGRCPPSCRTCTAVAPVKLVPVSVTVVPPPVEPLLGLSPVTVGAGGVTKVNWSLGGLVAEVPPPGVVTVTSTVPADSAGETMVIECGHELTTQAGARHRAERAPRWPR